MKTLDDILYLEVDDLIACGVAEKTVRNAKHGDRKGWTVIDDPDDKRKVLVRWDDLNDRARQKVLDHFGDPVRYELCQTMTGLLEEREGVWQQIVALNPVGQSKTELYRICQYLQLFLDVSKPQMKRLGFRTGGEFAKALIRVAKANGVSLPGTYAGVVAKARRYRDRGVYGVVYSKKGNSNAAKLQNGQAVQWLVAQYAQPNKPSMETVYGMYRMIAPERGWPEVSLKTVKRRIAEHEQFWYAKRHGGKEWRKQFEHTMKLRTASCRDRLWSMDGTKLDLWYQANGKQRTKKIYVVIDDYSEVILGYDLSNTEDSESIFRSVKKALRFSMNRPEQLLYDNQGGHKVADVQEFFDGITTSHFPTRAYNPQGKQVERVFGRFQKQVLRKCWSFTGQTVKSRNLDNQANDEFIYENRHKLPTEEELPGIVEALVTEWNEMAHPKLGIPRIQAYRQGVNERSLPLSMEDLATLTYRSSKPIQYRKEGLRMTISGVQHHFEVLTAEDLPCAEFRAEHLGKKLVVKYDPEDLDQVYLYDLVPARGGKREELVGIARPKPTFARALSDRTEGESELMRKTLAFRDKERERYKKEMDRIDRQAGTDREWDYVMGAFPGSSKQKMNDAESWLQGGDSDEEEDTMQRIYRSL